MKPAVWRIFQNNRWSYSDAPSTRHQDRPAWQPLYAVPEKEWVGLTNEEIGDIIEASQITLKNYCSEDKQTEFARAIEAALKAKNYG